MEFQTIIFSMSILNPLYTAFGYVMRVLYDFFNNFGIVIIIFTILLRAIMIPLGVKQFKSTITQQGMSKEMEEIKRRYKDDKQAMQKAQQELYAKKGFSPLSGCLPSIVQLVIIWPVYRIISAPLVHISGVPLENITEEGKLADIALELGLIPENAINHIHRMSIPIVNALNNSSAFLARALEDGLIRLDQLLDLNFLGMNLGLNPSFRPAEIFGDQMNIYLPLLMIPILSVSTTFLSMKINQWTAPNRKKNELEKERAKKNPAKGGQSPQDATAGMTKGMTYFMPLFTLWISFTLPAAMGLYWIVSNIMSIGQQYLLYNLITKRTETKTVVKKPEMKTAKATK